MASISTTPPIYQRRTLTNVLTFQDLYRILQRSSAAYIDGVLTRDIYLSNSNSIEIRYVEKDLLYVLELDQDDMLSIEVKDNSILVTDHENKQITMIEPLITMKL